jgi:mRNA interferase RelE/StbE
MQGERRAAINSVDAARCIKDIDLMATVRVTPEALEEAERLPKEIHARFLKLVRRLEQWPEVSGVKALSGNLAGWYRVRTGDYRVRFRVEDGNVIVDKIGHRREFYED